MNMGTIMKKLFYSLFFTVLCCACTGCHDRQYVIHETTLAYDEPSLDSKVVGECKASYREPMDIIDVNITRTFGRLLVNGQGAWIPLTDINAVAPCGTSDPNEKCDIYVVVPKKLTFYSRPSTDGKPIFRLQKGDTICAVARHEGWIHALVTQYTSGAKNERVTAYGWVENTPEKLSPAGVLTKQEYDWKALAKVNPEEAAKLQQEEYLSSGRDLQDNSLAMRIFWHVFRFLLYFAAVLALVWFVMVTFVTDNGNCDKWLLPFLSVVLWIFASVTYPHWYMVLAVPVAMMMFVYPLFFTYRAGRFFLSHLVGTALLAAFYMLLYNSALGKSSFILGLLSVLLATGIALWMEHRCRKYFCPHCHYYGKHEDMGFTDKQGEEHKGGSVYDRYDHSERHWGVEHRYYKKVDGSFTYRFVTRYRHYRCPKCGELFTRRSFTYLD